MVAERLNSQTSAFATLAFCQGRAGRTSCTPPFTRRFLSSTWLSSTRSTTSALCRTSRQETCRKSWRWRAIQRERACCGRCTRPTPAQTSSQKWRGMASSGRTLRMNSSNPNPSPPLIRPLHPAAARLHSHSYFHSLSLIVHQKKNKGGHWCVLCVCMCVHINRLGRVFGVPLFPCKCMLGSVCL